MKLAHCNNLMDFRALARRRLPAPVFHYLDGGADDEWTLARNTRAFDDYELMPSQLSDASHIDMTTTLFGQTIGWPVFLSPTGASKLFHAAGELAVARSAARFDTFYSLSTLGTETIEAVGAASDGPKLFQLYMFRDRGLSEELIGRARDAGFAALCLTVDTPVGGNRERDFVYGFATRPRSRLRQVASFLRHPGWLKRAVIDRDLEMANLVTSEFLRDDDNIRDFIERELDPSLTWRDVEWLAARWDGPLVIKGVQSVADCEKAAGSGASAVMLSNHGGRQLDSAPAPIDCVAAVADRLGDRLEIVCDGGIRRGTHVAKALAAGATACSIGRGYLFALAAGGERGVDRALELLRAELKRTMALMGCRNIEALGADSLRARR